MAAAAPDVERMGHVQVEAENRKQPWDNESGSYLKKGQVRRKKRSEAHDLRGVKPDSRMRKTSSDERQQTHPVYALYQKVT